MPENPCNCSSSSLTDSPSMLSKSVPVPPPLIPFPSNYLDETYSVQNNDAESIKNDTDLSKWQRFKNVFSRRSKTPRIYPSSNFANVANGGNRFFRIGVHGEHQKVDIDRSGNLDAFGKIRERGNNLIPPGTIVMSFKSQI